MSLLDVALHSHFARQKEADSRATQRHSQRADQVQQYSSYLTLTHPDFQN